MHHRRPSLSRWGRSSYETDADVAAEAAALDPLVELRGIEHDAEILVVTSQVRVDGAMLAQAPSARLVITTTSGYDHLDRVALMARDVLAARLPMARRDAVVEASLELLIGGLRQSAWLHAEAQAGRWARSRLPSLGIRTLRGATVAVVGLGVIGAQMVAVLDALGAHVLGVDPHTPAPPGVARVSLTEALSQADAVTAHCLLTGDTRLLLDRPTLAAARPGLVVVNTARGDVLDLDAAIDLLDHGHLGALGVDVFPREPYPGLARSAEHTGLRFTPHAAGYHDGLAAAVRSGLVETVSAWAAGTSLPFGVPGVSG